MRYDEFLGALESEKPRIDKVLFLSDVKIEPDRVVLFEAVKSECSDGEPRTSVETTEQITIVCSKLKFGEAVKKGVEMLKRGYTVFIVVDEDKERGVSYVVFLGAGILINSDSRIKWWDKFLKMIVNDRVAEEKAFAAVFEEIINAVYLFSKERKMGIKEGWREKGDDQLYKKG
jgi:hypothetical protein